ncbi:hypothetical protein [Aureitalea marina]|uniref:DUF4347 domain-containing protein n=1 Tax=Aureitalea marina TaxID=930804 RepID=A0A2S7KRZ4_9FLAO|nr:hypothetical protein [Aureitalea marina]PQB05402.1 hypothetical protein BST85_11260 [Aureitalea marina]
MNRLTKYLLLVLIASFALIVTQSCREDDDIFQVVVIDSQEELERLILGQSSRLEGPIILSGAITSLEVFENVEKIIGDFVIVDTQLTSLDGLENLILVTGDITITSNPPFQQKIKDFCALQTLINGGSFKSITITNNQHNPTVADIQQGNCAF